MGETEKVCVTGDKKNAHPKKLDNGSDENPASLQD
ncbi:hypothetical protein WN944_009025 [Citrus x changshan-huyou]|uniref:Uncharacterized protein n=1 Tax=Citrus x changshan-huyou TaxID=2935761 RepID=A0AAP0MRG0_9ROSI